MKSTKNSGENGESKPTVFDDFSYLGHDQIGSTKSPGHERILENRIILKFGR
ncbi:unnamed protein product [Dovyalis caffra]|uniref:Maturase K n=1 Tax=Dovyalis caffra TaxID=77055 RepID=A0AAV1QRY8_9ROSI|nr:unnamed protein product [Dovyalis caffra]